MSIASAQAEFQRVIAQIRSAKEYKIRTASGAWRTLASAGDTETAALASTAGGAAAEQGVGLRELCDRLTQMTDFTSATAAMAQQVSDQLLEAERATVTALQAAHDLEQRFNERGAAIPPSPQAAAAFETFVVGLTAEAQTVLDTLGESYAGVIAGEAPTAPRSGGPGAPAAPMAPGPAQATPAAAGAAPAGPAGAAAGPAGGAEATAAAADHQAANGSAVGSGEYPHSSVMGPEQGDFAGWTRDPSTGYLVDPATGREFDPATGRWIDPVTGKPFGEATEYAARLSGLGTGSGGLASPAGLALVGGGAGSGGAGGLAGLYGGVLPPSVAHAGPARGQALEQAMRNMNQRAQLSTHMAMREAAQGGRPFMPPPGMAGMGAGGAGRSGQGRGAAGGQNRRFTDLTEDPEVWAPRRGAALGVLGE
ncbi:hypothetical protein [Streptomyces litchfieldiae]|uniref:Uncharacterized protein n=1 Tax=Streptomyces litchfieldiae TaxID=3075543 RepID=A0ABU2MI76_9ACTN|nr:hypothetical protein [Streptomyces sp. DSM 44938]MDT0341285.1 hypothetical protein [Streptomyces sp. DSM 44938]